MCMVDCQHPKLLSALSKLDLLSKLTLSKLPGGRF
jgi:hypothetical protein